MSSSNKRLEKLATGLVASNRVNMLVRCIVGQSVETIGEFRNQAETELVNRFYQIRRCL